MTAAASAMNIRASRVRRHHDRRIEGCQLVVNPVLCCEVEAERSIPRDVHARIR